MGPRQPGAPREDLARKRREDQGTRGQGEGGERARLASSSPASALVHAGDRHGRLYRNVSCAIDRPDPSRIGTPLPASPNPQVEVRNPQAEPPLALVQTVANRQEVVAVCTRAAAQGIRPGLTLAESRALCPGLAHAEHDPRRDALGLEALGRWLTRFTPVVALHTIADAGDDTGDLFQPVMNGGYYHRLVSFRKTPPRANDAPDRHGLFLDVTGCERVFHGLDKLVGQVEFALKRMRLDARLAVAPTPGAAWAMTFAAAARHPVAATPASASATGAEGRGADAVVARSHAGVASTTVPFTPVDELPRALAPLPPAVLRLEPETVAALHHLGIDTIDRLAALPRESLPSRFGTLLTRRLDQALGRVAEPLVPLPYFRPVNARMDFDGVVESLEVVWLALRQLVERVVNDLAVRGCGARRMEAVFTRAYAPPLAKTVSLSRPSRDRVNLFNLLRFATEQFDTDAGFTGVRLSVPVFERLTEGQSRLHDDVDANAQAELDHLVERLVARLGPEALSRPQLVESHVPERAFVRRHHGQLADLAPPPPPPQVKGPADGVDERFRPAGVRPLRLLREPEEVRVVAEPSDDCNGRPRQLARGRDVHRLVHAVGPERIAGEWWRGHTKTRDYYDVEDESGKRFWLFRVVRGESARWFIHADFE